MLGKPAANWVAPAKVYAIGGEFMRQCDKLDGRVHGMINNYIRCRAIFDVTGQARLIRTRQLQARTRV